MHGCQQAVCAASEFACYMYAFVGILSMVYAFMVLHASSSLARLLASATAGVALLAPLASHRTAPVYVHH